MFCFFKQFSSEYGQASIYQTEVTAFFETHKLAHIITSAMIYCEEALRIPL